MGRFYTVRKQDGHWDFSDDTGKPFYSLGVNCFSYGPDVPLQANPERQYGGDGNWYGNWAERKLDEVWSIGFNTLGAWHSPYFMNKSIPKTIEIRCSRQAKKVNKGWGGFPDVFDPSFAASIHAEMVDVYYQKGMNVAEDRSLVGVFLDNELRWFGTGGQWGFTDPGPGKNDTNLAEDYILLPGDAAGKRAWVDYLRERYMAIERLNEAWQAEYGSFDELAYRTEYRTAEDVYEQDKLGFVRLIAETYFRTTTSILRMYDRNHLILGCRELGSSVPDFVLEAMKDYVDVISVNFYSMTLPYPWLERVHEMTGKPIMVTEFCFSVAGEAGFRTVTNGAQRAEVPNQRRRGECYRDFVTEATAKPYIVGMHWFAMYDFYDSNGLTGNYGLYDGQDRLWEEFAEAVRVTHRGALLGKTGETAFRTWRTVATTGTGGGGRHE